MNNQGTLLWVDDEIELLHAHILFLRNKGYVVDTVSNGTDAVEACRKNIYDLVLLDENMVGMSGLQTLSLLKDTDPNLPVVMVTKSEEEDIMEQAIGSKIADYLIKPVNPNQILLTLKKNLHRRHIESSITTENYRDNFSLLGTQIENADTWSDWIDVYRQLTRWELDLHNSAGELAELLDGQKESAKNGFSRFIKKNYIGWMSEDDNDRPVMNHDIFKKYIFPLLDNSQNVYLIVLDNFRYDQWREISPLLSDYYIAKEQLYYSILPTATHYARNALFSGLPPAQIKKLYPQYWLDEDDDEGKNLYEEDLIRSLFERYRRTCRFSYNKLNDAGDIERFTQQLSGLKQNNLNVAVVNSIDIMSHSRTDSKMMRELVSDESSYRGITRSWFEHSPIFNLFKKLSQETDCTILITTDHGSLQVDRPVKIAADRNTSTNLRYKAGKSLGFNSKDVFCINNPQQAGLPSQGIATQYIFATGTDYFVYQNNFNTFAAFYKNSFQHGGVSMEEMIIPLITLKTKNKI